jgi:hypothetical protein
MSPRVAALLALVLVAGGAEPAAAACSLHETRDFTRKADLPAGAMATFGIPMAERGTPFQATDVLDSRHPLPSTRFVHARQVNCALAIRFEQGGIAHTWQTAQLWWNGNRWVLVRRR